MELDERYRRQPQIFAPNSDWKIFFACKRGKSHIENDKVCQDYCVAEKISEGIFVAAVADGHGSDAYTKSDIGSKEACNLIVTLAKKYSELDNPHFLQKWTSAEFKAELFQTWQEVVLKDYRAENPDTQDTDKEIIRKYGTTLLFVVVTKLYVIIGQVGDGAILLFNDQNQDQLFKRHNPIVDSRTDSLSSGRGIYALCIESYRRTSLKFNNILLSTDGIYNKLDQGRSFAVYANELAQRVRVKPAEEIAPFMLERLDKDISEVSSDDCTVAAIISSPSDKKYELPLANAAQIFEHLKFVRAYDGLEIYSAQKDGKPLELHLSKHMFDEKYSFTELADSVKLLKSRAKEFCSNINVFDVPDGLFRVQELIEHGEHLEKRYIPSEDDEPQFTNEFWLGFYETVRKLKKFFALKKYFAEENLFKTMMISERGEIFLFADCLSKAPFKQPVSLKTFETLESFFSFLGKIRCGEKTLPLFKCPTYSAGQVVPALHAAEEKLCRVLYNAEKNIYGLQNLSRHSWLADGREIAPNHVLKITGTHTFELQGTTYETEIFATE